MFSFVEPARSRAVSRLALMAALAAGLAGCASDRFMEAPQASRQQASPEVTGSVHPAPAAAPSQKIQTSALPPPAYGGSAAVSSNYQPPARQEITGSVSAHQKLPAQPGPAWSWDGGTAIIVAQGETIDTISRRHGVPASAIMQANNMTHAAQLQPGQRLVIPRVQQPLAAPHITPPATKVAGPMPAPAGNGAHIVKPGETIYSLARQYRLTPMAIAKANNVGLDHHVKVGDRVIIPGQTSAAPRLAAVAPAPAAQPKAVQPAPQVAAKPAAQVAAKPETKPAVKPQTPPKVAQNDAPPSANIVAPAADPLPEPTPTGTTGSSSTSLRWPVRGKVIQAFGPKQSGGQNDGINVSVPEGTPIKAAEDGVVAYAGNELKGYGNLVLVRHSNGFVTAYAHASELAVKKGETIKRGQVIGKAGATGNVNAPQLHFEVRKGATPVDPMQYLQGG
jgi:murein DD-endopeptidase MepM/ murein hydrolase activator NlpD